MCLSFHDSIPQYCINKKTATAGIRRREVGTVDRIFLLGAASEYSQINPTIFTSPRKFTLVLFLANP